MHVRVVTPSGRTPTLLAALESVPNLVNLVVHVGVARQPQGDVLTVDVPNELANQVIALLRSRGADRVGSITIERSGTMLSAAADTAATSAPGESSEAVVWAEIEARSRDDAQLTISFGLMVMLAMLIASVGILTDSQILIIGAMVIGPEYGPLIAIAFSIFRRDRVNALTAVRTLSVGLGAGIAVAFVFALCVRALGLTPDLYNAGVRPLTQFITDADGWSVVVALLAALAGTISMTQARSSALVGVFISVTTLPAAANLAVGAAHGHWDEAFGAFQQLMLNLVVIVVAGVITFEVLAIVGRRIARRRRALP